MRGPEISAGEAAVIAAMTSTPRSSGVGPCTPLPLKIDSLRVEYTVRGERTENK